MVSLARGGTMPDMALLVGDDRNPEEFNMPPLTCIYLRHHILLAKTHCQRRCKIFVFLMELLIVDCREARCFRR